ncbi:MAG: undecaprenyldiphospho-muramoylpentapeptide beta-N-acetylglucosaminyltransferase [Burkholderiaceae bacterium]
MSHLVIMAAGTGGHIMPGIAVAQEMQSRGWSVSWLGTSHGMENRLVPPRAIPMDVIRFSGMRGKGVLHAIAGAYHLLAAFFGCLRILRRRSADAVLGMGGYVCLPGGLAAWLLRKPLVLVNADAKLLLSNRTLSSFADRICFGFAGPDAQSARHGVVTGNPVRAEISAIAEASTRFAGRAGPLHVLVIGGSLGAKVLNEVVPAAIGLLPEHARPRIKHQCGSAALADVQAAYRAAGIDAQVMPFIDDMAAALAEADVVVCRAGAITISELCAAGAASVLVPLIVSTTSHQRDNAQWLAKQGAAMHLPQAELTAQKLADLLSGLTRDALLAMAQAARSSASANAAARVADEIEKLTK